LEHVNDQLNVTPNDDLNSLRIGNSVASDLMTEFKAPVRVIEMPTVTDEKDHRFELMNGVWKPLAYVEAKARKFYDPPLVSCNKIDKIWFRCKRENVQMIVALWFDNTPDVVHWRWIDQNYMDWAKHRTDWFGHGKRDYRELGYPFPKEYMFECPALGKRLSSINSTR